MLHISQREAAIADLPCTLLGICRKKHLGFPTQDGFIESPYIALDFAEVETVFELVFADKVNLVLTPAIPPRIHLRVRRFVHELPVEVPLKREAGKGVEIPCNQLLELLKASQEEQALMTELLLRGLLRNILQQK